MSKDRSRRGLDALLLVVLTGWFSDTAAEDPVWLHGTSPSFNVISRSGETETRMVVGELERFRGFLDGLFSEHAGEEARETRVLVFDSAAAFEPYAPRSKSGAPRMVAGYFVATPLSNFIVLRRNPDSLIEPVVYHEYTHHFTEPRFGNLPLWFSEGLAEYFSTVRFVEDQAVVGGPIEQHLRELGSARWLSSTRLFEISGISPEYDESEHGGPFYAQAWLLTDYVLSGGSGRPVAPDELLALAGGSNALHDQLLDLLDLNLNALEGRMREYAFSRVFKTISYPVPAAPADKEFAVRPADLAEVKTTLGELMLFVVKNLEKAETHLRKAEQLAPKHPRTSSLLALLWSRQGHDDRARARFEAALKTHPKDARVPMLYGISRLEKLERETGTLLVVPPGEAPSLVLEARRLFRRSLELEPRNPEALTRLGSTFVLSPHEDPAPGIAALEKAKSYLGDRLDVVTSLALLYTSAGRLAEASSLLLEIERKSTDPRHLAEVREAMTMAGQRSADVLWAQGHYRVSVEILESLLEDLAPGDTRERLEKAIEERKRILIYNECIIGYNEAVELANGNRLNAALEKVGLLTIECKSTELKAAIWQLWNEIQGRLP